MAPVIDSGDLEFVPIFDEKQPKGLRVALAVRRGPDPVTGWFVPLNLLADAEVFLGALIDADGKFREWVEIWTQSLSERGWSLAGGVDALTNSEWDARWRMRCDVLERLSPNTVIPGPWQRVHQPPLQLLTSPIRLAPVEEKTIGSAWKLCVQDDVLGRTGLPFYGISGERFLVAQGDGATISFWGLGPVARQRERVANRGNQPLAGTNPVFNREGGLLFVRSHYPLGMMEFKRLIEGYPIEKPVQTKRISLGEIYDRLRDDRRTWHNQGLIFSAAKPRAYRMLECFLLKVLIFQEALALVAAVTAEEKRPFLTLTPEDFRVRLDATHRLPACWSFRLALARTSETVGAELASADSRDFRPLRSPENSLYQPKELNSIRSSKCTLRISRVEVGHDQKVEFQGTLGDLISTSVKEEEIVEIQIPLRGSVIRFLLRPIRGDTEAKGELRFRSEPHALSPEHTDALKSIRGWFADIPYRIFPMVSSPADLYSMGVMGLELLVDTRQTPLQMAFNEWLTLARRVNDNKSGTRMAERRRAEVIAEPRFQNVLGPARLDSLSGKFFEETAPDDALLRVIDELWWAFIDVLLKMIPGGPDSFAISLADAPVQALEARYLEALSELEALGDRAKSILFGDLWANAEALAVLKEF